LARIVERTRDLQLRCHSCDDADLRAQAASLKYRAQCAEPHDRLAPEVFALVCEAARRALGMAPYPVQIQAAAALCAGAICEMQTGEGKTLTATMPLALVALAGRGAHLATANDYLAGRDCAWMQPVFARLGLSAAAISGAMDAAARRRAYAADVTYACARELGFDFLRDRLEQPCWFEEAPRRRNAPLQREFHFLLIDEADSLLIDEARIPWVVNAPVARPGHEPACFRWCAQIAGQFSPREDYRQAATARDVVLTARGRARLRALPKPAALNHLTAAQLYAAVERAIRVARDFQRDRHYVVQHRRVVIVDESTGRRVPGRQWRGGLHQAIEAREGLEITPVTTPAARIWVPEFVALYPRAAGMTGTARPAEREFRSIYGLKVVRIPTHHPCRREEWPCRVLPTTNAKFQAIAHEAAQLVAVGRPVLIGTRSIERSEQLSACLAAVNVAHRVLNARQDAHEAAIVAQAGQPAAVTVATNMAGRGTDIVLAPQVVQAGGLHVIGTELHESSRIDRQLFGRAARQGDPGSFRQFVSLDDEILEAGLGPEAAERIRRRAAGQPGDLTDLVRLFRRAQVRVERQQCRRRRAAHRAAQALRAEHERMGLDPYLDLVGE